MEMIKKFISKVEETAQTRRKLIRELEEEDFSNVMISYMESLIQDLKVMKEKAGVFGVQYIDEKYRVHVKFEKFTEITNNEIELYTTDDDSDFYIWHHYETIVEGIELNSTRCERKIKNASAI